MTCPRHRAIALAVALALSACTVWRARPGSLDNVPDRDMLQLWVHDRSYDVHAVTLHGDSVRAVPGNEPADCRRCALYFQRAAIDSVRSVNSGASIARTAGVVGAVLVAGFVALLVNMGGAHPVY